VNVRKIRTSLLTGHTGSFLTMQVTLSNSISVRTR